MIFGFFLIVQVGTNGIVSFGKGFRFYTPSPFPTSSSAIQSLTVVAPFWSDNDLRKSGSVSYEVFTNPGSDALQSVSGFVSYQTNTTFVGTWMLLSDWSDVHQFPHGVGNLTSLYSEFTAQVSFCTMLMHIHTPCM